MLKVYSLGKTSKGSMAINKKVINQQLYVAIKRVLVDARSNAYRAVNSAMVTAYWNIGTLIVEDEQKGRRRADYGKFLIQNLSDRLTREFGKGFDERNLFFMKQFYLTFPKVNALRSELSWTHYRLLMRVDNETARKFYLNECAQAHWSTRQLERQITSFYYERLLASKNKAPIKKEAERSVYRLKAFPEDQIKDPYVLEFLGLQDQPRLRESRIEQALIDHLQKFLLELGHGFSFVSRQYRISTETQHFFIDLVFYNYLLKCFVLIDLKSGKLTHQDVGQMDMYVRLFEDKIKGKDDNSTIGIILCSEKDETIVKYSVLNDSKKLFASKYKLYLPSEKELGREIEKGKYLLSLVRDGKKHR